MACEICLFALTLVEEAQSAKCTMRMLGGAAVAARCRVTLQQLPELARTPNDIDFIGLRRERAVLEVFLESLGLKPHREFNFLSGGERLLYALTTPGGDSVRVDVLLDRLDMCHMLKLSSRLYRHWLTISATDLLLSKLQVVFPSERDAKDTLALLATFSFQPTIDESDYFELDYVCKLCGSDWGWHHTVMINLQRVEAWLGLIQDGEVRVMVRERARVIMAALVDCPKTWRWQLRNLIGERLRWYQIPEELVVE
jgi:hypothetical protein